MKKILTLILTLCLLLCLSPAALAVVDQSESFYAYARKEFLPGDTNSDGIVNARDANRILLAAAALGINAPTGLSSLETAESDLNADGILNAKDANITLAYAAAIGVNAFSGSASEFAKSRYLQ